MTCFVNICDHDKLLCLDAPLRKASYNLALICPQNAPHTQDVVTADEWDRPYSREAAAFPAVSTKLVYFLLPTSLPLKTDGRRFAVDLNMDTAYISNLGLGEPSVISF